MSLSVPDLTIGPPTIRFGRIGDVDAGRGGEILVLDLTSRAVNIFDGGGKLVGSLDESRGGRQELGGLLGQVLVASNEQVYVPDPLHLRVLVFRGTTGQVLEEITLPEQITFLNWALGPPGGLFVCAVNLPVLDWLRRPELPRGHACSIPRTSEDLNDMVPDTPPPIIYRLEHGRLDEVLALAPDHSASSLPITVEIFSPAFRMWTATGDGTLWVADARHRELIQYSSKGVPLARHGIPLEPETIRPGDRELIARQYASTVLPQLLGTSLPPGIESLIRFTVGDLGPPFRGFLLDSDSRAWLGMPKTVAEVLRPAVGESQFDVVNRGTSRWTVVEKGEVVGSVEFAKGFRLTRIRGSYAYGFRIRGDEAAVVERYKLPL